MNKTKIIIIAGIVVMLVIAVFLIAKFGMREDSEKKPHNALDVPATEIPAEIPVLDVKENVAETEEEIVIEDMQGETVKQIARVFVEQWGSLSKNSDFSSLDDAKIYATESMKNWLTSQKKQYLEKPDLIEQTVTTVLGLNIFERNENKIVVHASARRVLKRAESEVEYNQKAVITLIKQGDLWLVDRAEWSKTTF